MTAPAGQEPATAKPPSAGTPLTPAAPVQPDKAQAATPAPEAPAIGTGFPEPAAAEEPRVAADGKVILATARPYGSLTLPPLEHGGPTVVITPEGTEVDEGTAQRAREAAHLAGFRLREL